MRRIVKGRRHDQTVSRSRQNTWWSPPEPVIGEDGESDEGHGDGEGGAQDEEHARGGTMGASSARTM